MVAGVPKETTPGERRVAIAPTQVATLAKAGVTVRIEKGAGVASGIPDAQYEQKGAELVPREKVFSESDVVLTVRCGAAHSGEKPLPVGKKGQVFIGMADPWQQHESFKQIAENGATLFSMELIPRITRAQSMDVLSSMANLAGYKSVLLGANSLQKMFPMLMTAAGTIVAARVFVVGVGVAGLQAIATARRLGAIVSAYDVRPAVKDEVKSLGAKFVELDLGADAEGEGGYAKEMDEEFYRKQREMMLDVVKETDVVITTASVPGKPAPRLITEEMVKAMPPGSVVVDLAAERGGNCELTRPGETVEAHNVTIVGPENVASSLAGNASQLYSKNITTFLQNMMKDGELAINTDDEIVDASLVIQDGQVRNEQLKEAE